MWTPATVDEIRQGIGVLEEGDAIDFKVALASGADKRDLGKDVAAMSLYGGVIIVGADEKDGTLTAVPKVALRGAAEQIEQIIATRVTPPLRCPLRVLRDAPGDDDGVVVIVVPASLSAPHQADGRYPARAGSTTRTLTELEVSVWYERRRVLQSGVGTEAPAWLPPAGSSHTGWGGIGRLELTVWCPGAGRLPQAPRLGPDLSAAVAHARDRCGALLRSELGDAAALSLLGSWRPRGSLGWEAGAVAADFQQHAHVPFFVAATLSYENVFSALMTFSLETESGAGRCAYEHLWVRELLALLSMAASVQSTAPAASLLAARIAIRQLDGAVSFEASHGRPDIGDEESRVRDASFDAQATDDALAVRDDARALIRQLLDPLLVSFVDRDTIAWASRKDA